MRIDRDEYLDQLIQRKHSPYIKIVTGVRRCGKSYLLKALFRVHPLSYREYYVQVMDTVPADQHGENEYDSLRKVPGSFRKIVVANSPFKAYVNEDGILVISLEEFLLDRNSLNL